MKKADLVRFRHMLDAAKEAVEISSGKSRQDIENERLLNLSLVRLLEIMVRRPILYLPIFKPSILKLNGLR